MIPRALDMFGLLASYTLWHTLAVTGFSMTAGLHMSLLAILYSSLAVVGTMEKVGDALDT